MPARGTRKQRGYDETHLRLRKLVIAAQPWCSLCGATSDLTVDHIIPLKRGGETRLDNYRVLCRSCNSRRGAGDDPKPPALPRARFSRNVLTGL
jgi:5-methylcytosine-specific restriction endonuclease McrA